MSEHTGTAAMSPAVGAALGRGVADGSGDEVLSVAGSTSDITFAGGGVGDAAGKGVGDAAGKGVGDADGKGVGDADGRRVGDADGKGVGASVGAGLAEAAGVAATQMQASVVILLHILCKGFSSMKLVESQRRDDRHVSSSCILSMIISNAGMLPACF